MKLVLVTRMAQSAVASVSVRAQVPQIVLAEAQELRELQYIPVQLAMVGRLALQAQVLVEQVEAQMRAMVQQ